MKIVNDTFKGNITDLDEDQILVFGSNTEGRHGKGVALLARNKFGAVYGQSHGRQGRCFAIITKDISKHSKKVGKWFIVGQILELFSYAINHPHLKFLIPYKANTKNLNGYSDIEMASFFEVASGIVKKPENIYYEESFKDLMIYGKYETDTAFRRC